MLSKLIAEGRPLLADGATGTNLIGRRPCFGRLRRAVERDPSSTAFCALHQSFVDAGADIILTNSFGANRRRLDSARPRGARAKELKPTGGAKCARGRRPGGPSHRRGGFGRADRRHARPARISERGRSERRFSSSRSKACREGGADVVWIETMSAPEEARAAARGDRRRRALHGHRELRHGGLYNDGD